MAPKTATNGQNPQTIPRAKGFKELGLTGLDIGPEGSVSEEFLPNLMGRNALAAYKEMQLNDPTVGAILFAIDGLIRSVDWRAEGDEDVPEEDVEFLEECMNDMSHSWSDFVSEVMTMLPYGYSFFEIVYKRRLGPLSLRAKKAASSRFKDGKIGWRKFAPRSQDSLTRWIFDEQGGVQAFVQSPPPDLQERIIPLVKGLLFRTTSVKNSPEGRSVLRNAYRPWFYKKKIEEIEAVGIERDLAGMPLARIPPEYLHEDAGPEEVAIKNRIERIVRNLKRDRQEGIVWPNAYDEHNNQMFELELLSTGGTRQFDTTAIVGRYDQRIAQTTLADFILLGHEKVGSFALSSDKTDLFAIVLGSFLSGVEDVLNRYAVPRLWAMNGMPLDHLPQIKHGDIEHQALEDVAAYITALAGAGMPLFPDDRLEQHLREIGSLPEKSPDADPQPSNQPVAEGLPPRPASLPPRQVRPKPPRPGSPRDQERQQRRQQRSRQQPRRRREDEVDLPS